MRGRIRRLASVLNQCEALLPILHDVALPVRPAVVFPDVAKLRVPYADLLHPDLQFLRETLPRRDIERL